jgi:1,4-alpha-glucan branching enzyme
MRRAAPGSVCIVLHGHLPYVHHPSHADFLEEDWLFEAVIDCYLPLLFILDDLARDRVPCRFALNLSPPLLEMLRAPILREKTSQFLARRVELAQSETRRLRHNPVELKAARHYAARFQQMAEFHESHGGDLVEAFRRHQDGGRLEILASAATHAVMPLVVTPEARRFQIAVGVALYREVFGKAPAGFWLPECAYTPGLEHALADAGIGWVILESHGVLAASPRPWSGLHRPVRLPGGVAAFGRDRDSGRQVWSSSTGYPGDPDYRELYRDVGFDAPYDYIHPHLHADGIRRNVGIKYHRVTGKVGLDEKQLWNPAAAKARASEHARHFLDSRATQVEALLASGAHAPCVVAPYDCELFGHWWYEGPWFLEALFREAHARDLPFSFLTPSEALDGGGPVPEAYVSLSTWGRNGFLEMWLNDETAWMLRHQNELERRMAEHARRPAPKSRRSARILDQMARELLLAQSSDWAFILTQKTAAHYAEMRLRSHVDRFFRLEAMLEGASDDDEHLLETLEEEDALFPGLDHRGLANGPIIRPRARLGTAIRSDPSRA